MINPVGPSIRKYKRRLKKIKEREICRLTSKELLKLKKGERIPLTIPVLSVPHFIYSPWGCSGCPGGGGSEPEEPVYGDIDEEDIIKHLSEELELEMIKPGGRLVKDKITYPGISKRGDNSLLNIDGTIFAMIERMVGEGTFEPGRLEINLDEDDLRYNFPKIKYREEKDAVVVFIRDVSSSINEDIAKASEVVSYLIKLWLEQYYSFVDKVYIAHNAMAWEEKEEQYFKLGASGGTVFSTAYDLLLSMIEGRHYESKADQIRTIDSSRVDVYAIHMTDGENWPSDYHASLDLLGTLFPHLTRFCYLGIDDPENWGGYDNEFEDLLLESFGDTGKLRVYVANIRKDEYYWGNAMKAFFGKNG